MAAVSPLAHASRTKRDAVSAEATLTDLYERHARRVFRFCRHWLRSREEAEDAVQTTFLNAFRGLDRGVVPAHEEAWLLSIARNVCLSRTDAVRRRAVEVPRDPHTLAELVAAPMVTDELDGLNEALAALTEQQRRAILLREWHGLSYREIAETLALSQAAVETLLFRARRTLARHVRRPLGIGGFAPWLRSLGGGGAGKLAVGAAVVAITATTGAIAIAPLHQQPRAPHGARGGSATRPTSNSQRAQPANGAPARRHGTMTRTQSTPQTTRRLGTPSTPRDAVPTATPASAPIAVTTTTTTGTTLPTALLTATNDATGATSTLVDTTASAADTVVTAATSAIGQAANTAVGTATDATATVQATTQAVANTVTTILPPPHTLP